jgi:hypothetical protein
VPGPYWHHQVGEEIRGVIAAAGITPNAATLTQLLTALQQLFGVTAAGNSIRLPTGHIFKWGSVAVPAGGNVGSAAVSFTAAFPSALHLIVGNADRAPSGSWSLVGVHFANQTAAGATMVADTGNPSEPISAGMNVKWLALGI